MRRLTDTDAAIAYSTGLLRGERVYLREVREDDLAQLSRWWNDPATLPLQQSSVRPIPGQTMADRFRLWTANTSPQDTGFAVVRSDDDALIGQTGLKGSPNGRSAEFVIVLGPDFTSRGFGTETVRLMLRFAFAEVGLHRVELRAWGYNTRAIGAYLRAGFVEEGRRRDVTFHNGHYGDEVIMGILEQEWWARTEAEDATAEVAATGTEERAENHGY
jgi:RimJ/RimL family protein N-acetyltransferase